MTTLGAPANSGGCQVPERPWAAQATSPAQPPRGPRHYLEGRAQPVLRSPPTLALARAARAGTHPGLSSRHEHTHTHTCSLTRTAREAPGPATQWEPGRRSHWFRTRLQSRRRTHPGPLFCRIPCNPAHPCSPRGYRLYSRSLHGHPNTYPHPIRTREHTHGVPMRPLDSQL